MQTLVEKNQKRSVLCFLWQGTPRRRKLQRGASIKKNHIPPARPLRRRQSNTKYDLTYLQNRNAYEQGRSPDITGGPCVFPFNLDWSVILQAFRSQEDGCRIFSTASFLSRDPKEFIDSIFSHFVTLRRLYIWQCYEYRSNTQKNPSE